MGSLFAFLASFATDVLPQVEIFIFQPNESKGIRLLVPFRLPFDSGGYARTKSVEVSLFSNLIWPEST